VAGKTCGQVSAKPFSAWAEKWDRAFLTFYLHSGERDIVSLPSISGPGRKFASGDVLKSLIINHLPSVFTHLITA
jgi:hypothetical protein